MTAEKSKGGKFNVDLNWNFFSFGFIAVIGLGINVAVVKILNFESLGVFNQVLSFYLILSQLSSFGIHLSIQRYIPEIALKEDRRASLVGALFTILVTSVAILFISHVFFNNISFFSREVRESVILIIPSVLLFTLNKLFLSYLMGMREMKAFALFNTLRYVFMGAYLLILIYFELNIVHLFTITELSLFLILVLVLRKELVFKNRQLIIDWFFKHFHFGRKSFFGNLLMDANTKIDIIVLGLYLNNEMVGIYSFAAMFYEGFTQVLMVLRNNLNPIISKAYFKSGKALLNKILKRSIKKTYKYMATLGGLSIIGFPVVLLVFDETEYFYECWSIFSLLMLSNILFAGLLPLSMVFNQMGMPGKQTLFFSLNFALNLGLNLLLIPFFDIYGAAIALFIANTVCNSILVKYLFKEN